ncbi:hypothetical protein PTT_15585 [Pyrenophora teres f. teres 0-1]|uniref:Uncharacterized protein n=2 Tax=Pyrenophora teres f. teres TaxID=97479 RepID=E3S0K0_PYRTT|nr:hypothetical protein PTT_15585 [Pyrenophora teres f. teres 0-1]CAE7024125.1 hypothetical protein PTTW11_03710 [Pyrenophora teres f. teres]
MSTTYLSIHDLLRITYTYEMQAAEAEANMQLPQARLRSDSACSMPEICAHLDPLPPHPHMATSTSTAHDGFFETDFTEMYCRKGRCA